MPPNLITICNGCFEDLKKKEQEDPAPQANLKPLKAAKAAGIMPLFDTQMDT